MSFLDIAKFLIPNDTFQWVFLGIIIFAMLFAVLSVHAKGNEKEWEKKWKNDTPDDDADDLGITHGSVTDLWHAVATWPEKLAEVMPGMLLVLGLLGTFLGLGIALNHASHILGQPNALSADATANSMQDLLPMMQGLGTKFKTSTWGILGYIILKIWSEIARFDEKRMSWVIAKVSKVTQKKDEEIARLQNKKQAELFSVITKAAEHLHAGFLGQTNLMMKLQEDLHGKSFHQFAEISTKSAQIISENFANQTKELTNSQKDFHKKSLEQFQQISEKTSESSKTLLQFTQNTASLIDNMAASADKMAEGAGKVGQSADELMGSVNAFSYQFKDVLDSVRTDLSAVLNNVRSDLSTAITEMSTQANQTLERGSQKMETATRDISVALDKLSGDVRETMGQVQSSIQSALQIQQRSAAEFTVSSQALNESLAASTSIVENLGQPIKDGLQSVADAGQHMRSVGKKLDDSLKGMSAVGDLAQMLTPLKDVANQNTAVLAALKPLYSLPEQHKTLNQIRDALTHKATSPTLPISTDDDK